MPENHNQGNLIGMSIRKTWTEYMRDRVAAREVGTPWHLMDKTNWYKWCEQHELPTVEVLRKFNEPETIDLYGLDGSFVLKPTSESAMKGVMILTQAGENTFQESLQNRTMTQEEIVAEQQDLLGRASGSSRNLIIERKIDDKDPNVLVPRDFKAYTFNGHVELIAQIDRSTQPAAATWYDSNFNLVTDGRIRNNSWYIKNGSAEPPAEAEEILSLARRASSALKSPFARIDMYNTITGPIVGELTLTPGAMYYGTSFVLSSSQDYRMGLIWEREASRLSQKNEKQTTVLEPSDRILNSVEQEVLLHELQVNLELDGKITVDDYRRLLAMVRKKSHGMKTNYLT